MNSSLWEYLRRSEKMVNSIGILRPSAYLTRGYHHYDGLYHWQPRFNLTDFTGLIWIFTAVTAQGYTDTTVAIVTLRSKTLSLTNIKCPFQTNYVECLRAYSNCHSFIVLRWRSMTSTQVTRLLFGIQVHHDGKSISSCSKSNVHPTLQTQPVLYRYQVVRDCRHRVLSSKRGLEGS